MSNETVVTASSTSSADRPGPLRHRRQEVDDRCGAPLRRPSAVPSSPTCRSRRRGRRRCARARARRDALSIAFASARRSIVATPAGIAAGSSDPSVTIAAAPASSMMPRSRAAGWADRAARRRNLPSSVPSRTATRSVRAVDANGDAPSRSARAREDDVRKPVDAPLQRVIRQDAVRRVERDLSGGRGRRGCDQPVDGLGARVLGGRVVDALDDPALLGRDQVDRRDRTDPASRATCARNAS